MTAPNAYETSDLNQAAFLLALGHPLKRVGGITGSRRVFFFDAEASNDAVLFFQNHPVPARNFSNALRDLKALLRA